MVLFHKWALKSAKVFEEDVAGENRNESLFFLIIKSEILHSNIKGLVQPIPKRSAINSLIRSCLITLFIITLTLEIHVL